MSGSIKTVLVVGAGGNAGVPILKALNDQGSFKISVLSRKGSKTQFPAHINVISIDPAYSLDELVEAFKGQDAVVDLAPLGNVDQHLRMADAAVKAGVKRFMPGEFGSNTADEDIIARMSPIFDGKKAVREYLQSKEKDGLTWTGLINGPFFDWGIRKGFISFEIPKRHVTIYDGGNNRTDLTLLPTIGQAVASILLHPAETANRYVHINSFFVSQNEILAALEKATGGSKWSITHADTQETFAKGKQMILEGNFAGFLFALNGLEWAGGDAMDYGKHYGLWNEKLGLPETNLPGALQEAVDAIVAEGGYMSAADNKLDQHDIKFDGE